MTTRANSMVRTCRGPSSGPLSVRSRLQEIATGRGGSYCTRRCLLLPATLRPLSQSTRLVSRDPQLRAEVPLSVVRVLVVLKASGHVGRARLVTRRMGAGVAGHPGGHLVDLRMAPRHVLGETVPESARPVGVPERLERRRGPDAEPVLALLELGDLRQ